MAYQSVSGGIGVSEKVAERAIGTHAVAVFVWRANGTTCSDSTADPSRGG